jgi:heat shock protein HtpX
MATAYTYKDSNIRKTWFLMSGFFIIVILLGWLFSAIYGNPSILYIAVIISIVMNIASYWYSDSLVLAMTGAHEADPNEYRDLHNIVENLAITAGLPKPRVFVVEDPAPNAFATGRDPEHSVVCVTTGLLPLLTKVELEGVIAHELSHIGNRDMLLGTVAVVLVGFVSIICDIFRRASFYGGNSDRDNKAGTALFILGIIASILAPLAATMIQLAISRKREFLADASGVLLTRYPDGLATALQKIGKYGQPMQKHSSATAHLFISNPLGRTGEDEDDKAEVSWFAKLFSTHPPIKERIAALVDSR